MPTKAGITASSSDDDDDDDSDADADGDIKVPSRANSQFFHDVMLQHSAAGMLLNS